jgi:hypothetical protein
LDVAQIVCDWLGGSRYVVNDDGRTDLAHDINIELSNGGLVALEVTRWTSDQQRKFHRALEENSVAVPSLQRHWILTLDGYHRRVNHLMAAAPSLVAVLEGLGIERFPLSADYDRPGYLDTIQALRKFGIANGQSSNRDEGWIALVPSVVKQTTMPEFVKKAQEFVNDNADKLQRAGDAISMLGVLVDSYAWSVHPPMAGGALPTESLDLQNGPDLVLFLREGWPTGRAVDVVWAYTEHTDLDWCAPGWTDLTAEF